MHRPGLGAVDRPAVDDECGHHALGPGRSRSPGTRSHPTASRDVEPDRLDRGVARALPGGARRLALAGHGGVEAGDVDRPALRAQRVLGEVEREAEGVVEAERDLARQRRALAQAAGLLLEQAQAALERAAEVGLLELQAPR